MVVYKLTEPNYLKRHFRSRIAQCKRALTIQRYQSISYNLQNFQSDGQFLVSVLEHKNEHDATLNCSKAFSTWKAPLIIFDLWSPFTPKRHHFSLICVLKLNSSVEGTLTSTTDISHLNILLNRPNLCS